MQIDDFYFAKGGSFWGAFINGELVGTIALVKFDEKSGAIRKMFVKKEFRGKEHNIAQKLLETLISYCHENGIDEVYLGTVSILNDYSDESVHPIPTQVDSRFDDDFLG